METPVRIAIAQTNLVVGDIEGNADRVIRLAHEARDRLNANAIVFPELTLTGYPPEDLLLRSDLYQRVNSALTRIAADVSGIDIILGYPELIDGSRFNAAGLIRNGKIAAVYHKQALPNYSVFDEKRYFKEGREPCVIEIAGRRFGLTICEDIWQIGPVKQAVEAGAEVILNLNASPYHLGKWRQRQAQIADQAARYSIPIIYVNLVGGQDELVFDGHSFAVNATGDITQRLAEFVESLGLIVINNSGDTEPGKIEPELTEEESVYKALVLGVRDYVEKNNFGGVVIGLSGGVDSALTLTIAVDAIGAERVEAVMMPSVYTSTMSLEDAQAQADALAVAYSVIDIAPLVAEYDRTLAARFAGLEADVTEENIQARIRGNLLMAISNKSRRILLTTGNKSEMAVGYATLYGDMAGGFATIKDISKTMVYRLAKYRNTVDTVIPERVLTRPPSAELAPDQKDSDSLPDYDTLDAILERYVELDQGSAEIVDAGFDAEMVIKVIGLVDRNEYKRRQAAPGVRITARAFGRDRRYPITSGYKSRQ